MTDSDRRIEEANQQRKVENQSGNEDDGIIGSVETAVGSIVRPITTEGVDNEMTPEMSEANDQEQREDGPDL